MATCEPGLNGDGTTSSFWHIHSKVPLCYNESAKKIKQKGHLRMDYKFPKMDETESTNCCHMLINGLHDVNKSIIELVKTVKQQNEMIENLQKENRELRDMLSPSNNLD